MLYMYNVYLFCLSLKKIICISILLVLCKCKSTSRCSKDLKGCFFPFNLSYFHTHAKINTRNSIVISIEYENKLFLLNQLRNIVHSREISFVKTIFSVTINHKIYYGIYYTIFNNINITVN